MKGHRKEKDAEGNRENRIAIEWRIKMNCCEDAEETGKSRNRIVVEFLVDLPRGKKRLPAAVRACMARELVSAGGTFLHKSPETPDWT
jgi:hypothetical protein